MHFELHLLIKNNSNLPLAFHRAMLMLNCELSINSFLFPSSFLPSYYKGPISSKIIFSSFSFIVISANDLFAYNNNHSFDFIIDDDEFFEQL